MHRNRSRLTATGAREVKRRLTLPALGHERDAQVIAERLARLPGVRGTALNVARHRLWLVYDVTCTDHAQVLEALEETGFPVPDTWWWRMLARWRQGRDETGRANAKAPVPPRRSDPRGLDQANK